MKITLAQLVGSTDQIKALQAVELPIKVSYKINRLVKKLDPELQAFHETRNSLILELGEKQEDGTVKITDEEKLKQFNEKLTEIIKSEIDVDWFKPIKIEEMGEVAISSAGLETIYWMFDNE